jgi:integrase
MSRKNSHTTSDALNWNEALNLIHRLYRDGDYRMSLLIGCGCFFGLRISDLRTLRWNMLLEGEKFEIREKKTGKFRQVKINKDFQKHINDCYNALKITEPNQYCFLSTKKVVFSTQRINVLLKKMKQKYKKDGTCVKKEITERHQQAKTHWDVALKNIYPAWNECF